MDEIELIYEDNHLLVVIKPAGVPSQEDATGDPNMLTRMKAYIKAAYNKPGEVYLGLVHRLDRPVGGIMCFARTSKAAARLSAQLKSGAFKKTYLAVVEGKTPERGALTDYLFKVEEENRVYVADERTPGAKLAKLAYRTLAQDERFSLVEVELFTGRSHQIRVQFAQAGFPLWGDHRYGRGKSKENIALFAARLRIEHPTRKEPLEFVKPPPSDTFPWRLFASEIQIFAKTRKGVSVIYEDEALLIAEKPPGLETQGETSAESIAAELAGGPVYACHRLDAMTGGLLIFAKTEAARDAVQAAMKAGHIRKTYRCIVKGIPAPPQARLTAYLIKDAERARVSVVPSPVSGAKRIETAYRVIERGQDIALLEVEIFTGRTHQIRAHMAYLGHPLLGDDKYGDRAANKAFACPHQALWAVSLAFAAGLSGPLVRASGQSFASCARFGGNVFGENVGAPPQTPLKEHIVP